jgi:hypothetical protein
MRHSPSNCRMDCGRPPLKVGCADSAKPVGMHPLRYCAPEHVRDWYVRSAPTHCLRHRLLLPKQAWLRHSGRPRSPRNTSLRRQAWPRYPPQVPPVPAVPGSRSGPADAVAPPASHSPVRVSPASTACPPPTWHVAPVCVPALPPRVPAALHAAPRTTPVVSPGCHADAARCPGKLPASAPGEVGRQDAPCGVHDLLMRKPSQESPSS